MSAEQIRKPNQQKIVVTDDVTRDLVKEFGVSYQTIRMALRFFTESKLAIDIRTRAIEKMDEVNQINKNLKKQIDE